MPHTLYLLYIHVTDTAKLKHKHINTNITEFASWKNRKQTITQNQTYQKMKYLSDMVAMVLKARISERSGFDPRFCQRPREDERKSLVTPLGLEITVDKPPSASRGLVGPPTRTGSLSPDSLAKVRHSEVSSME